MPFDLKHLQDVLAQLAQAKQVLDKKESVLSAGVSSLSPQMKREQFAKEVVGTPLFKDLQQEFFKIVSTMGEKILTICQSAYNKGTLTNEQRDALATIGNKLTTEIPFEMLGGSIDVKKGFSDFISTLLETHQFFDNNLSVVVDMGEESILSIFEPLENFVQSTTGVVNKPEVSLLIKE